MKMFVVDSEKSTMKGPAWFQETEFQSAQSSKTTEFQKQQSSWKCGMVILCQWLSECRWGKATLRVNWSLYLARFGPFSLLQSSPISSTVCHQTSSWKMQVVRNRAQLLQTIKISVCPFKRGLPIPQAEHKANAMRQLPR